MSWLPKPFTFSQMLLAMQRIGLLLACSAFPADVRRVLVKNLQNPGNSNEECKIVQVGHQHISLMSSEGLQCFARAILENGSCNDVKRRQEHCLELEALEILPHRCHQLAVRLLLASSVAAGWLNSGAWPVCNVATKHRSRSHPVLMVKKGKTTKSFSGSDTRSRQANAKPAKKYLSLSGSTKGSISALGSRGKRRSSIWGDDDFDDYGKDAVEDDDWFASTSHRTKKQSKPGDEDDDYDDEDLDFKLAGRGSRRSSNLEDDDGTSDFRPGARGRSGQFAWEDEDDEGDDEYPPGAPSRNGRGTPARGNREWKDEQGFKQGVKTYEDDWKCLECGAYPNFASKTKCFKCFTPKGMVKLKPRDWTCTECGASPNFASRRECFRCGAPRPPISWQEKYGPPESVDPQESDEDEDMENLDWQCQECGESTNFAWDPICFRCGSPRIRSEGETLESSGAEPSAPSPVAASVANVAPATMPQLSKSSQEGSAVQSEGIRCLVENLSEETDAVALQEAFLEKNYPVIQISVLTDPVTQRSLCKAIVEFGSTHAAHHAIREMAGYELDGKSIAVSDDLGDINIEFLEGNRDSGEATDGGHELLQDSRDSGELAGGGREWRRIAGTGDSQDVDEKEVLALLAERDIALDERDIQTSEDVLDDLFDLDVSFNEDENIWWVGQREDSTPASRHEVVESEKDVEMNAPFKDRNADAKRASWSQVGQQAAFGEVNGAKRKDHSDDDEAYRRSAGYKYNSPSEAVARGKPKWRRVPGSEDNSAHFDLADENKVLEMLAERDIAKGKSDFKHADNIREALRNMGVHFEDRGERIWWLGRRGADKRQGSISAQQWKRVAGSGDDGDVIDARQVVELLIQREAARAQRDFRRADSLLDRLIDLDVSFDDDRNQMVWWVGRREDGGRVGGRGAAAAKYKRRWTRVAGSRDDNIPIDVSEVMQRLVDRDKARLDRDFQTADHLLHVLSSMDVSVDDRPDQRTWWFGRRALETKKPSFKR